MKTVTIKPVLNGWIVKVGCQTVVFEKLNTMLDELRRYIEYPEETEKRYEKNAVNKNLVGQDSALTVEPPTQGLPNGRKTAIRENIESSIGTQNRLK